VPQGTHKQVVVSHPIQNNLPNKYSTHFPQGCYETLDQSCLLTWTLRSIFCLFEGQTSPKRLQILKCFDFYYPQAWEVLSFLFSLWWIFAILWKLLWKNNIMSWIPCFFKNDLQKRQFYLENCHNCLQIWKGYLRFPTFIFWRLPNLVKHIHGCSPFEQSHKIEKKKKKKKKPLILTHTKDF